MIVIESWIAVMIAVGFFAVCLIALAGWIYEGEKLQKQIEKNQKLQYQLKRAQQRLAHKNAVENIKAANEYYNTKEK